MAFQLPGQSSVTGTGRLVSGVAGSAYGPMGAQTAPGAANVTGYNASVAGSTMLNPAIQTIWSKEILFQSMPVLRFEQFAVKKTELGTMPGLSVNFMRYNNLPVPSGPLLEGVRMKTHSISAQQYRITVAEQGFATAVTELLLNASFDDIMASTSRLLGRNMAMYMDSEARQTLQSASSVVYGYKPPSTVTGTYGVYGSGTQGDGITTGSNQLQDGGYFLTPAAVKDASLALSVKNIPRLGETYIMFIHPVQSRQLRDHPEFIEVTKYAAPGNFMLGEIGRLWDVVFIETTQVPLVSQGSSAAWLETYGDGTPLEWRTAAQLASGDPFEAPNTGGTNQDEDTAGQAVITNTTGPITTTYPDGPNKPMTDTDVGPYDVAVPAWDTDYPNGVLDLHRAGIPTDGSETAGVFEALMLGDNAFGHAVSLPVELRDGGVMDFGREHALAWYAIWGFGLITDSAVVKVRTNA